MDSTIRTRTFSWDNPLISAQAARSMSGLDYLLAVSRSELPAPPILHALGFERVPEVALGKVTFFFEPQEYHYNPLGSVHGGVFATLLDSAMGCAVHSTLPAGVGYTTLELKVNFIKPLTIRTGLVRCEGQILSAGRQVIIAEGRIMDESGKLYAHATTSCLILHAQTQK